MNKPAGLQVGKKVLGWPESGDSYSRYPAADPCPGRCRFLLWNFCCLAVVGSHGED